MVASLFDNGEGRRKTSTNGKIITSVQPGNTFVAPTVLTRQRRDALIKLIRQSARAIVVNAFLKNLLRAGGDGCRIDL